MPVAQSEAPVAAPAVPTRVEPAIPEPFLDVDALEAATKAAFPTLAARGLTRNPHAAPGSAVYDRFVAALRATTRKRLEMLVHGTAEHNIDAIAQQGLRIGPSGGLFLTSSIATASGYTRGAGRLLACAVLRDASDRGSVAVLQDVAHVLPLFVLAFESPGPASIYRGYPGSGSVSVHPGSGYAGFRRPSEVAAGKGVARARRADD